MQRLILAILLIGEISACEKIPGTGAYERRTSIEGAEAAAAYDLIDPASAQFRNIKLKDNIACGEVNGKNRIGAYVGFVRFIANRENEKWTAELDPRFGVEAFDRAKRVCVKAASPPSGTLAQLSCLKVIGLTPEKIPQFRFHYIWKNYCKSE